ncbi:hypothetical protein OAH18_01725 [bacterium]|nr:hypothetical protein [bacterium]
MKSPKAAHAESKWWQTNGQKLKRFVDTNKHDIRGIEFEVSADLCESCHPLFSNNLRSVFGLSQNWPFEILVFVMRRSDRKCYQYTGIKLTELP